MITQLKNTRNIVSYMLHGAYPFEWILLVFFYTLTFSLLSHSSIPSPPVEPNKARHWKLMRRRKRGGDRSAAGPGRRRRWAVGRTEAAPVGSPSGNPTTTLIFVTLPRRGPPLLCSDDRRLSSQAGNADLAVQDDLGAAGELWAARRWQQLDGAALLVPLDCRRLSYPLSTTDLGGDDDDNRGLGGSSVADGDGRLGGSSARGDVAWGRLRAREGGRRHSLHSAEATLCLASRALFFAQEPVALFGHKNLILVGPMCPPSLPTWDGKGECHLSVLGKLFCFVLLGRIYKNFMYHCIQSEIHVLGFYFNTLRIRLPIKKVKSMTISFTCMGNFLFHLAWCWCGS